MIEVTFPSGRKVTIEPAISDGTARLKPGVGKAGMVRKAWNYSRAVAKWIAAGSPLRSDEEIARVLAICKACPLFVGGNRPHCRVCGCSLNSAPDGLVNKIAMRTESCPLPQPRWTATSHTPPTTPESSPVE